MPRKRISPSQFKSKLRSLENKQKQAIRNFNQQVKKKNREVKRAVNKYNQEVRSYNARVKANRQRVLREFSKIQSKSTVSVKYKILFDSVNSLHHSYTDLEENVSSVVNLSPRENYLLDLSERENANSLEMMNTLLDEETASQDLHDEILQDTAIVDELVMISEDLDARWRGAIFALNPDNPDAARHFCTSAREIFTQILDITAPDKTILDEYPDCEKTKQGSPTRKEKIKYLLRQQTSININLEEFVNEDIDNILQLYRVFNDGTHGSAGKYDLHKLYSIKKRVEEGVIFLANIVSD